ncbi:unnamed protein product [Macrosiphum euphorbiae]|uniref:Uncharacterized protein n=1 Tax=Macrosiphum euphorbiae TaxID=13131 RepID=A0AAV0W0P7_9HEMI|nr:unnamed protein product [Macrosiphum euphorbiae]
MQKIKGICLEHPSCVGHTLPYQLCSDGSCGSIFGQGKASMNNLKNASLCLYALYVGHLIRHDDRINRPATAICWALVHRPKRPISVRV